MNNLIIKYQKKSCILFCLFLLYPVFVFSQLTDWENYTNGNRVFKILNDGGYLWIATDGGLVKMNKATEEKSFYNRANAGLPENHLRSLAKDKDGNIWVTTQYNGIGKFDGTGCTVYNSRNSGLAIEQYCMAIATDNDNNVWVGTLLYLNKFNGDHWQVWTTPNSIIDAIWVINDLKFDDEGVLWMGGMSATSGFYFAKFTGLDIERIEGIRSSVQNIAIDGNIKWLATEKGLVKYDGTIFTTYLPDKSIFDVKKDASGNLWLATGRYLMKYDGIAFTTYDSPLISNDETNLIYCLEVDDDGTVWIGTRSDGLIKFSNGVFTQINLSNSPLLENDLSFHLDIDREHNVRFGTKHNMVTIDADNNWSSSYEKINYSVAERRVKGVASDLSGNLWISLGISDTCLLKINQNDTIAFTQQNSPLLIREVLTDPNFCFA